MVVEVGYVPVFVSHGWLVAVERVSGGWRRLAVSYRRTSQGYQF
jgi:hypothetical protein